MLTIAYKMFASILRNRLLEAGVDQAIVRSQFGFRAGWSTEDAIFIARRSLELAHAWRNGKLSLLALDWQKAFDSINVISLLDALRRFGLPQSMLDMISGFLHARKFFVKECGNTSAPRQQNSGISQGCTLSPLLFILVMTVLVQDAVQLFSMKCTTCLHQVNPVLTGTHLIFFCFNWQQHPLANKMVYVGGGAKGDTYF